MSNTLDIDRIVNEVMKCLYLRFGIKVLIVIDHPPQPDEFKKYIQSFNVPWVTFNLLLLNDDCQNQVISFRECGLIIDKVYGLNDFETLSSTIGDYSYMVLSDISITESEQYANFSFNGSKGTLVYQFLKNGREVYYFSQDLVGCEEAKPLFMTKLNQRVSTLTDLGVKMIHPAYQLIEGVCDFKTLKQYEGGTVMLAKGTILSPLAKDYIQSGAVKIIRK